MPATFCFRTSWRKANYACENGVITAMQISATPHGLFGAMEWEGRKVAAQSGIRIQVSNRITQPVPKEMIVAVFRIFQEGLTNAVRHSRASTISARLSTTPGRRLALYIRDNGVGFSDERSGEEQSLGLLGMRERAQALGGELRIKGRPGHGTLLALRIPLDAD